jgi:2,3-bisphosphoglycerate-dependent phosphoglycerate mutase
MMKFFIFSAFVISLFFFTGCETTYRIYIVRHAEKSLVPADDPHLTVEGRARAEALRELLTDKDIKAIFSTQKNRTVETAMPLSKLLNVPIQYYGNDTLPAFLKIVAGLKKNTLIVGHSNTTVTMVSAFNLDHSITVIPDDDYDNLFIIDVKKGKAVKITETTYGALSPAVK